MRRMSDKPHPRTVVLAAIDASPASAHVVASAARFATTPGGELHIVHVIDSADAKHYREQVARAAKLLDAAAKDAPRVEHVTLHIAAGTAWREILQIAANTQADVLVIGSHDLSSIEKLVLGSVADPVVHKAQCPVFVVRRKDYHNKAVPEIEPPCPDCLTAQRESGGRELWCEHHKGRHAHGRTHYELPEPFALGMMLIRDE